MKGLSPQGTVHKKEQMVICYLVVGSNLGDRKRNIKLAVEKVKLLKDTRVLKLSRIIETLPVDGPKRQQKFLNAALKINTNLAPKTLLNKLKIIEKELGRRKAVRNGPRVIDIDILLYGDKVVNAKDLIVPHPRMFKRDFVISTLSEVI